MKAARLVMMFAMIAAMPAVNALAEASNPDILTRMQIFVPQRTEDWDAGSGVELQARFWSSKSFGTALSLGFDSWAAKSEFSDTSDAQGTMTTSIYGNMTVIPVGVSALYRNNVSEKVALVFEAGVRYLFLKSNINADVVTDDASGTSHFKDKITTDNVFAAVFGVSVESAITDTMSFHLGVGYQLGLTEPHETFSGEDMGTTSFNSPIVDVGVTWAF